MSSAPNTGGAHRSRCERPALCRQRQRTPGGDPRIIWVPYSRLRPIPSYAQWVPFPTSCTCYRRTLARRSYLYSERSRVGPRTCGSLRARLGVPGNGLHGFSWQASAPRLHHAARRRGCVAPRGAPAAAGFVETLARSGGNATGSASTGASRRAPMHSELKVSAAAADDESCQK